MICAQVIRLRFFFHAFPLRPPLLCVGCLVELTVSFGIMRYLFLVSLEFFSSHLDLLDGLRFTAFIFALLPYEATPTRPHFRGISRVAARASAASPPLRLATGNHMRNIVRGVAILLQDEIFCCLYYCTL